MYALTWTAVFLLFNPLDSELINNHLIISANTNPLMGTESPPVTKNGLFDQELLNVMAEILNFTYEICPPKDVMAVGTLQMNGSWTGGMGQVQRKEVDLYISTGAMSWAKFKVADMSVPVVQDDTAIIVPFPSERSKTALFIAPFQTNVWATLLVLATFVTVTLHISTKEKIHLGPFCIATFTSQDLYIKDKGISVRIVVGCWILSCIVLVNGYTAIFTSLLTVPRYVPIAATIKDVANNGLHVHVLKGSSTEEYITSSTKGPLKILGDQLRRYPDQRIETEDIGNLLNLLERDGVFIGRKETANSLLPEDYKSTGQCRFTLTKETFFNRGQSIFLQKNSPLTATFNEKILLLQQFGFVKFADRPVHRMRWPCSINAPTDDNQRKLRKLQLADLSAAFVVLYGGLLLALVAFIGETIAGKCKCRK